MKCPVDQADLQITDRQGVEIDFCPRCRGVWLDRGELDKIVERMSTMDFSAGSRPERRAPPTDDYRPYADPRTRRYRDDDDDDDDHRYRDRRRRGWFGDLFDFD